MATGIQTLKMTPLQTRRESSREKIGSRPVFRSFGESGFTLEITKTQLIKSTINANKTVRRALRKAELFDFSGILPGGKEVLPCTLRLGGQVIITEASFLIPKRRGDSSPEPRFWPYKLNRHSSAGSLLWFIAHEDHLEVRDTKP